MLGSGALETPSRSPQSGVRLRKCLVVICPGDVALWLKILRNYHVTSNVDNANMCRKEPTCRKNKTIPERDPKQRCKEYDEDIPGWVLRVPQPSAKIFVEDHVSIKDFHAREIPEKILLAKSLYKISKILLTRSLDEISAQAHTKRAPMARSLQQFFMQDPCPRSLYMTGFLVSWQDLCTRFL